MRTRSEQTAVIKADQQFWRDLAAEIGPNRYDEPGPEHVAGVRAWLDEQRGA